MVTKSKGKTGIGGKIGNTDTQVITPMVIAQEVVDPSLARLFASSAGPVKAPSTNRYHQSTPARKLDHLRDVNGDRSRKNRGSSSNNYGDPSITEHDPDDADEASSEGDDPSFHTLEKIVYSLELPVHGDAVQRAPRKRKRTANEDDLEGNYMLRIAKEEEKEEEARQAHRAMKRQKTITKQDAAKVEEEQMSNDRAEEQGQVHRSEDTSIDEPLSDVPQHESLAPDNDANELEKASRTVFLANVSATTITDKKSKKTLVEHMAAFLDTLLVQEGKKKHKIESMRFRSTAYAGNSLPKKAAFVKKNLMEATTKSTNAYVVYSTAFAAREAVKRLNGTLVLDRHLRVDGVAHPAKTDHRRCVFVGNLGFVDDEGMLDESGENERKRSKVPSDVEEGLWRQFGKAGNVESVRVVRDEKTRVGKGFAYVQFYDANSVEAALLFHDKKYPPMLPRVLRVTRAKAVKKTALASQHTRSNNRSGINSTGNPNRERIYNPRISEQRQSLQGRAGKLLGKAGAARFREDGLKGFEKPLNKKIEGILKTPENIIFEGYRASPKSGRPKDLKLGGSGGRKKKGKLRTRSSKRASEWKKKGRDVK